MGKDYDAAVMSGGLCGFMLGTTANAMANMEALVDRYVLVNMAMLSLGLVKIRDIQEFSNSALQKRMREVEDEARREKRGLWSETP